MSSNETNRKKTFKEIFKFYKSKNSSLNTSELYDFNLYGNLDKTCHFQDKVKKVKISFPSTELNWETVFRMMHPQDWEIFNFTLKPGLIFIRNPFSADGQRYWIARCLKDFTKKPNCLNIDAHNILNENEDWWEFCQREHETVIGKSSLKKLRWATLGYHHNWDTKQYSEEARSEFPKDLEKLCWEIARVLGFHDFKAEAAIINMYHINSSLNGHTDHSELNLNAPLFSFSFGQSAVFLIGGKSIDEEPIPVLLESGDIIVMSKEARLCYHGVPRIVKCNKKLWDFVLNEKEKVIKDSILEKKLLNQIMDENFWKPFESYVSTSRINMNVRQVLFSGQSNISKYHDLTMIKDL